MVVKNYKAMCELLGEPVKGGDSKRSQIKQWERFFYWTNQGHKFIIKEIYEEPLPPEDGRFDGNRSIYVHLIEWILAQDLSNRPGYSHTLTKKRWWRLLGMVNERYKRVSVDQLRAINQLHDEKEINLFYNRSYNVLNDILRNALKSMTNRALIDYEIQTIIVRPINEGGWF